MLSLEDRILRIELLIGIVSKIPKKIAPLERVQKLHETMSITAAKMKCICEYFEQKDQQQKENLKGDIYEPHRCSQ